jgi:hypothetical protein
MLLFTVSREPFWFLDLPREIRDRICENVLDVKEPPKNTTGLYEIPEEINMMRYDIEPQLLRTCRSICTEGTYIMRETNLFISVKVKLPGAEMSRPLALKQVPIKPVNRENLEYFKGFVMSHEIKLHDDWQGRTFVLLCRDLGLFCRALSDYRRFITSHDELVSHTITLVNPYESDDPTMAQTFHSRKLQEKLVAPYRKELHAFNRFTFGGSIAASLKTIAEREVASPLIEDPDAILREMEALKLEGNEYFRLKDLTNSSESWCKACMRLDRAMAGITGRQLRETGGVAFINRAAELYFEQVKVFFPVVS